MSKKPLYKQIEKYLTDIIDNGEIKPGEILPSENQISEKFNVSRMTVRTAFNNLYKDGYITRKRGIGSIVLENKISDDIGSISSFTSEMKAKGYNITTKLISLEIVSANEIMSKKLKINKDENVWEVKRVRYAEDQPISYMVTYMPVKLFPNLKKESCQSLYKHIVESGFTISEADRSVEAIISNDELKKLLELDYEVPILYIKQVANLKDGQPFEYSHTYHYGYRLTIKALSLKC